MRNYIKYLSLFIILILVGVIGINLYSKNSLKTTEKIDTNKEIQEETTTQEDTNITEEPQEEKTDNTEKTETTDTSKTTTSSENNTSTEKTEEVKKSANNIPSINSTEENTDSNPIILDVTISSNTTSSDNHSSNTQSSNSTNADTDVNIIDVTNSNDKVKSITETKSQSTNTTTSESKTTTQNTSDVMVIEIDNSIYKENTNSSTTSTTTKTTATKEETNITANNTTTNTNEEKNQSTTKKSQESTTDTSTSSTKTNQTTTTSATNQTTTTTDSTTLGSKTNIDFSNIDQCVNNKVVKSVKGSNQKTIKIHECIAKYNLNNINSIMQNFAITDEYVYFSHPGRGAWVKTEAQYQKLGKRGSLQKTSANYVTRVNRKTNTYQRIYVEYAGHSQSFDVTNNNEQIYMNYFARLYKGSLGYGAQYVGVTSLSFKNNTNTSGVEVVPASGTSVSSDGKTLSILNSSSYYKDGKLDTTSYYNKVVSIGSSSNKMKNPEIAIDEDRNRMALVSGTTAYIYNLSDFQNGKSTILKKFTIAKGKQGIELYNGYLYLWTGNKTYTLRKYNINTGKVVNQITFNLYNYYGSNKGGEAEGISIYNGNVYIGIPGSKCSNGKVCNDIFMVEGF